MLRFNEYICEKLKISKDKNSALSAFLTKEDYIKEFEDFKQQLKQYKRVKVKEITKTDCYYVAIKFRNSSAFTTNVFYTTITLCVPGRPGRYVTYDIYVSQRDNTNNTPERFNSRKVYSYPGGRPIDIFPRRSKYETFVSRDIYEIPIKDWQSLEDDFKDCGKVYSSIEL